MNPVQQVIAKADSVGRCRTRYVREETMRSEEKQNSPINTDRMSRTAGSGEPKDSDNFSNKGAAIFQVGGSDS